MKRKLSIVLFGLVALVGFLSFKGGDEEAIPWSKSRRLTWEDYKGKPQKRFAAASTVYSLSRVVFSENQKVFVKIQPFFWCNDSWKKKDWINDDVLEHEQTHFDIVELYAREFRKQAQAITCSSEADAEKQVEKIYHEIDKQLDAYQDKYDNETDGSMNGDAQHKWNKKVADELQASAGWQEPIVELHVGPRK